MALPLQMVMIAGPPPTFASMANVLSCGATRYLWAGSEVEARTRIRARARDQERERAREREQGGARGTPRAGARDVGVSTKKGRGTGRRSVHQEGQGHGA